MEGRYQHDQFEPGCMLSNTFTTSAKCGSSGLPSAFEAISGKSAVGTLYAARSVFKSKSMTNLRRSSFNTILIAKDNINTYWSIAFESSKTSPSVLPDEGMRR